MNARRPDRSRSLILAANLIAEQYRNPPQTQMRSCITEDLRQLCHVELNQLDRLRQVCRDRGWKVAEAELQRRIVNELRKIQTRIAEELQQLHATPVPPVKSQEVYRDLLGLVDEFPEVRYCSKTGQLVVVTLEVELEELYLGPFEIRLDVASLSPTAPADYQVVALDPHPAAVSDNVTHPHVRDEYLCEGEAFHSIRLALKQGRMFDFFLMVNGVLQNYNDGSPYVRLSEWSNGSCEDCGGSFDPDEGSDCHCCGASVCGDCSHRCDHCDESHCHSCSRDCELCHDAVCQDCLIDCAACNRAVCPNCFEQERCKHCVKRSNQESPLSDSEGTCEPVSAPAAVP